MQDLKIEIILSWDGYFPNVWSNKALKNSSHFSNFKSHDLKIDHIEVSITNVNSLMVRVEVGASNTECEESTYLTGKRIQGVQSQMVANYMSPKWGLICKTKLNVILMTNWNYVTKWKT